MKAKFKFTTLFIVIVLLTVGCAQAYPENSADDSTGISDLADDLELRIYLDAYTKDYMSGLIDQFVRENPNVNVITEDYSDLTIPDFRTKLAGDLMAGDGPDVILAANQTNNTVQNLTKLLQNGAFQNLDTLNLNLSAYNSAVLTAGQYNGKQYLIPLNYSLGFLLTTEERLVKYGIQIDGNLQDFAISLQAVYDNGKNAFLDLFTVEFLYRHNGLDLIDHQQNKLITSDSNLQVMQALTEAYSQLFPQVFEGNSMLQYQFIHNLKDYNYSVTDAFLSENLIFFSAPAFMGAYENLNYLNSVCNKIQEMGETPILFQIPSVNGNNASPCVNYFLLVNGNTSNISAAKLFIESAVGVASQYAVSAQTGIPVNNDVLTAMRDFYVEGVKHDKYDFIDEYSFPAQITDIYFTCIDNMSDGVYIDVMSCGRLFSILRTYLTDGGNFEDAWNVGKKQLEMYLTE